MIIRCDHPSSQASFHVGSLGGVVTPATPWHPHWRTLVKLIATACSYYKPNKITTEKRIYNQLHFSLQRTKTPSFDFCDKLLIGFIMQTNAHI